MLLTDRSLSDIAGVEAYSIEQWGKKTAAKYLSQIEDALTRIGKSPELLQQLEGFPTGFQYYVVNKHVLAFDVDAQSLILLAVLHGSMDIPSRLSELVPTLAAEIEIMRKRLPKK